jgi:hypothetical protein
VGATFHHKGPWPSMAEDNRPQPGMVAHLCNPSYSRDGGRRITVQAGQDKSTRSNLKAKLKRKRTGCMAQMLKHLPSKCKALYLTYTHTHTHTHTHTKSTMYNSLSSLLRP